MCHMHSEVSQGRAREDRATPNSEARFPTSCQGLRLAPVPRPRERFGDSGTCTLVQEVGQEAAQDGLVADDQHVLLALQLHDHRLQALHQVLVGLQDGGQGAAWGRSTSPRGRPRVTQRTPVGRPLSRCPCCRLRVPGASRSLRDRGHPCSGRMWGSSLPTGHNLRPSPDPPHCAGE